MDWYNGQRRIQWRGPHRPYFQTKLRPEGTKTIFLETTPSPSPLSHGLDPALTLVQIVRLSKSTLLPDEDLHAVCGSKRGETKPFMLRYVVLSHDPHEFFSFWSVYRSIRGSSRSSHVFSQWLRLISGLYVVVKFYPCVNFFSFVSNSLSYKYHTPYLKTMQNQIERIKLNPTTHTCLLW